MSVFLEWGMPLLSLVILIVTCIAVWYGPIKAVAIGQRLQKEQQENNRIYQNKLNVFSYILGSRHVLGSNETFVMCINQIPIIFHSNSSVLAALNKFIEAHRKELYREDLLLLRLNDLILKMAEDLGYSNLDNDLLDHYFYPKTSSYRHQADDIRNELYVKDILAQREKVQRVVPEPVHRKKKKK